MFDPMRTAVIRKEHFNAAHRLYNPRWSDEQNDRVFGKCNNPNFHGHNYELLVKLIGEADQETGYVYDMKALSDIIKEEVIAPFDHRNLNQDVPEFRDLNPTAENIAMIIWQKLRKRIDSKFDLKVTLYETERNIVEYPA
jgi:6-pyruvoyltetrahydropterin/6-carboxytetrahydropterin synthase